MKIQVSWEDSQPRIILSNKDKEITFSHFQQINAISDLPHVLGISEEVSKIRIRLQNSGQTKCYSHARNKALGDALKYSPTKFIKHFNRLMFKTFIAEQHDVKVLSKLCYDKKGSTVSLSYRLFNMFKKTEDKIMQCNKDGIIHIAPLVMVTNKTPAELKTILGKGLWKSLCSNSLHRNKLIAMAYFNANGSAQQPHDRQKEAMVKVISDANQVASTVLKKYNSLGRFSVTEDNTDFIYFTKHYRGKYTNARVFGELAHLIRDTNRMGAAIGVKVKLDWSIRRIKEEHDRLVKRAAALQSSPEPLEWLMKLPDELKQFQHNGFKATLLMSPASISAEGLAMSHCVGTLYKQEVIDGRYLVFSITDESGERYSTLGCRFYPENNRVVFDQNYKKFNQRVDNEEVEKLALTVVESYRKIFKPEGTINAITN